MLGALERERKSHHLLMRLASNYDNAPALPVHALEQEKNKQPVTEVIRRECVIISICSPHLLSEILEPGIEN
jgi:hypothetical protein